uniref:Osteopetrosis associated transmembrane protein n=1 Tax=Philodina roseola TaxID=96448 RepID=B2ZFB8_PHIRO|nr:osteopetrosis associated transmembrane protein [Philodina roseola]
MIFHRIFLVFLVVVVHADYRDPIYPIENPCLAILTRLAQVSADFLNCAVTRSRPFRLCEGCVTSYGELFDLINLLTKTYSDLDRTITCQQFLESYDSIQLVAQMITFVDNVWSTSFCLRGRIVRWVLFENERMEKGKAGLMRSQKDDILRDDITRTIEQEKKGRRERANINACKMKNPEDSSPSTSNRSHHRCIASFHDVNGTIYSNLTTDTVDFFNKKVKFDLCLYNATGQIVPTVPIDLNVTANTSVCSACVTTYNDLNDLFLKMTQENEGVCMDLVDTMNYTRLLWSKIYACRRHDPDYMAVIGISVFIPTLVLVFYVSAVFKGKRKLDKRNKKRFHHDFFLQANEKKKNYLDVKKRLPRRLAANARVDTQTWLWSNPNE